MGQFTVYENPNPDSCDSYPYLLDVQNEILKDLNTRVVIPLCYLSSLNKNHMGKVSPVFKIKNRNCVLLTPQLAGVSISDLGPSVVNLKEFRTEIVSAIDFIISGF